MCDYCSWIQQILARINVESKQLQETIPPPRVDPAIIVHGGAGRMRKAKCNFMLEQVKNAAIKAYRDLIMGYSAVDALDIAISCMEDTLYTNYKKTLHTTDEIIMDAAIMTNDLNVGAAGVVRNIEHPIKLARQILENTDHLIIVEKGAHRIAKAAQLPILPQKFFLYGDDTSDSSIYKEAGEEECLVSTCSADNTSEDSVNKGEEMINTKCKREEISMIKSYLSQCHFLDIEPEEMEADIEDIQLGDSESFISIHESSNTVGAVAYDRKKCLSCGISTMGEYRKPAGSMSAMGTVVGCGFYADENGCCSVCGDDKALYRYGLARKIVQRFDSKTTMMLDLNDELEKFEEETGISQVGAIALSEKGEPSISFRSVHFPWACCQNGYVYYGCKQSDKFCHEVKNLNRPLDCMCEKPA